MFVLKLDVKPKTTTTAIPRSLAKGVDVTGNEET